MDYIITIKRREPNPEWKPAQPRPHWEQKEYPEPSRYLLDEALSVTLTEEEFKAVKKAVVEVM